MRDHPETDDRQDRDIHESLGDLCGDAATLAIEVPVHQGPLPRRFRRTTPRALLQLSTCAGGFAITRNTRSAGNSWHPQPQPLMWTHRTSLRPNRVPRHVFRARLSSATCWRISSISPASIALQPVSIVQAASVAASGPVPVPATPRRMRTTSATAYATSRGTESDPVVLSEGRGPFNSKLNAERASKKSAAAAWMCWSTFPAQSIHDETEGPAALGGSSASPACHLSRLEICSSIGFIPMGASPARPEHARLGPLQADERAEWALHAS